jgi:ABC-type microcin C transport system duplicated ATPase subunit YejF
VGYATEPRLLALDEPPSALDVTIQAQLLRLLREVQARRALSYLFISHDIVVVAVLCARVLVLERGRIVEEAASADLLVDLSYVVLDPRIRLGARGAVR